VVKHVVIIVYNDSFVFTGLLVLLSMISRMSSNDDAVRSTNDDAASCKRSAVQLGYWSDPYLQFVTKASDRKPPEISRGYYARVRGIQGLVRQFLEVTIENISILKCKV